MIDIRKYKVKDELSKNGMTFELLEMYDNVNLELRIPNIIAKNAEGEIIWIVQPPEKEYGIYHKIYFKDNKLFGITGWSEVHQIDEATGKVINSRMIK